MKVDKLREKVFRNFLLLAVSLSLVSCSNLFGSGDSGSSSSDSKPAEVLNQPKTITVTGDIKICEELTGSGAIPEEYRSLFSSINNSDNSQERTAFPTVPTTGYYVTATDGDNTVTLDSNLITTTANGASFSMDLPTEDPEKVWTIEAGMTASFNGSQVVILKDTCTATPPTFYHEFVIKPLSEGNGNVDLTINYQTANTADTLELYFGDTKITAATANGEALSTTKITLKNRVAGAHKAKLVFKKNGYVVYTDYQGINIFPNMTTNTWVSSGGNGPVTGSTYKLTDTLVQDYLLTQIYVGSTSISGVAFTADDTTGNGTVFAPFETLAKAIDYLQKNGDTTKDYTIWLNGQFTGPLTISDGSSTNPTPILANSLTISGFTGNTTDKLIGGTSGSVLYLDTSKLVKIKNLMITGGNGTTVDSKLYGGGIYINKGSVELTTGVVVDGNTADVGGGVYLADGTLYLNDTAVVGKPLSALGANPTCAGTTSGTYANKATQSGGGIEVYEGTLWLGYRPPAQNETGAQEVSNTTGGVIYNLVAGTAETHGGGIDNNHGTLNIAHGFVSYNYAFCESGYTKDGCGGGITTADAMYLLGDATISHNESAYGGAVYISKGRDGRHGYFTMSGGTIESNASYKQNGIDGDGGGIAIGASGSFEMSGGTIKLNTAESKGGAIYHNGSLCKITGSTATIPKGTNDTNDINLNKNGQVILITGTTGHTGDHEIAITPGLWSRGHPLFHEDSTPDYFSKFKISDDEWKIVNHNSIGKLDADIWVASSGTNTGRASTVNAPPATASERNGTKSKPYATIAEAVSQVWDNASTKTMDFTIKISGSISGNQNIANTVANAKSITLIGDANATKKELNAGNSGTVLTVTSAVPVTIKDLTITGGYASGSSDDDKSGGGIKIAAGSQVILDTGVIIDNNYAQLYGGGVFLSGANAKLTVKTGAMIGKTSTSTANSASSRSNYAGQHGGGICADNGANVIINGGTISYNFAGAYGGGLAVKASSTAGATASISGSPSITRSGGYYGGGALYVKGYGSNNKNATVTMTGGTIDNCYSDDNYSAIQISESGVLELGGSVSIPYSDSDTKNYINLTAAGYAGGIYVIGSIKFVSELSNHSTTNTIKVHVEGSQDFYKNLADITASSSSLLDSELPKIDFRYTIPNGYAQRLFFKDTSLDSTGKSAYFRLYRGTKLPTATKGLGYIMFNDGSSTPYSANLNLHNDQKAAAVAVIIKTSSGKAYGVGLKQEPNHGAWADSEATAIAFLQLENAYNAENGKTCLQGVIDFGEDLLINGTFSSTTFPAMWWASHYEESITNEGIYTSGWYLPAKNELKAVYDNKSKIDSVISLLTSTYADSYITENNFRFYWSATNASDDANGDAWCVDFSDGSASRINVPTGRSSVAIREF